MQAVILAAGKGVRMRPLTDSCPKPLLKIGGRPLLEYTFDALPTAVNEVILVIGYLGEQIQRYLGDFYRGKKIGYVTQKNLEGTAKALLEAQPFLDKPFLVLMADDIYAREDIEKCLAHEQAILAIKTTEAGPGGRLLLSKAGALMDVVEGKEHPSGSLVSVGVYILKPEIFTYEPVKLADREGEWGLPQTVAMMAKKRPVDVLEATRWIKLTTPEDLARAEEFMKKNFA